MTLLCCVLLLFPLGLFWSQVIAGWGCVLLVVPAFGVQFSGSHPKSPAATASPS